MLVHRTNTTPISPKEKWPNYLLEFLGLTGFVLAVGLTSTILEHPELPAMKSALKDHDILRRLPLGIVKGVYVGLMIWLFGKKTGAHINPAVTTVMFRLKKMSLTDAGWYLAAQFAGAACGAFLLKLILGRYFTHPAVHYGSSLPKPPHNALTALLGEFMITFVFMYVTLRLATSRRFEKYLAPVSGLMLCFFVITEFPFSGTSLNPARAFGAAIVSNEWRYVWVYFLAPTAGMLTATEFYLLWQRRGENHNTRAGMQYNRTDDSDYKEIPHYPAA